MVVPLALGDLLVRARVLKLYRQAIRVARRSPPHARAELMLTIRQEFENNRGCNDKQRIRFLLSEGRERLKALDEMVDNEGALISDLTTGFLTNSWPPVPFAGLDFVGILTVKE